MKKGLIQNLIAGAIASYIILEYASDTMQILSGNYFGSVVDGWGNSMLMFFFVFILGINLFTYRKQKDKALFWTMSIFCFFIFLSILPGNKIKLPLIVCSSLLYLLFLIGSCLNSIFFTGKRYRLESKK